MKITIASPQNLHEIVLPWQTLKTQIPSATSQDFSRTGNQPTETAKFSDQTEICRRQPKRLVTAPADWSVAAANHLPPSRDTHWWRGGWTSSSTSAPVPATRPPTCRWRWTPSCPSCCPSPPSLRWTRRRPQSRIRRPASASTSRPPTRRPPSCADCRRASPSPLPLPPPPLRCCIRLPRRGGSRTALLHRRCRHRSAGTWRRLLACSRSSPSSTGRRRCTGTGRQVAPAAGRARTTAATGSPGSCTGRRRRRRRGATPSARRCSRSWAPLPPPSCTATGRWRWCRRTCRTAAGRLTWTARAYWSQQSLAGRDTHTMTPYLPRQLHITHKICADG